MEWCVQKTHTLPARLNCIPCPKDALYLVVKRACEISTNKHLLASSVYGEFPTKSRQYPKSNLFSWIFKPQKSHRKYGNAYHHIFTTDCIFISFGSVILEAHKNTHVRRRLCTLPKCILYKFDIFEWFKDWYVIRNILRPFHFSQHKCRSSSCFVVWDRLSEHDKCEKLFSKMASFSQESICGNCYRCTVISLRRR